MYKQARGQYLYHYTTLDNFIKIFQDGSLKPTPQDQDNRDAVCLTRNPNMHLRWPHKGIKLTLDANKLNVSLKPFLHQNKENQPDYRYEAEERCYREIKGLLRYLVRVDININSLTMVSDRLSKVNRIVNNLEAYNIPYELSELSEKNLQNPEEVRKRTEPLSTELLDSSLLRLDQLVESEDVLSITAIMRVISKIKSLIDDVDIYTPNPYENEKFAMDLEDAQYLNSEVRKIEDDLYEYSLINDRVCFEIKSVIQALKELSFKATGKTINFTKEENDLVFLSHFKILKNIPGVINEITKYIRTKAFKEDEGYDYSEFSEISRSLKEGLEYYKHYLEYLNSNLRKRSNYMVLKNKLTNYYQRKNR